MNRLNFSDIPTSVYRLQLSSEFSLKQAISLIPYLHELGVEGVYCSPLYAAYSSHGYDITDPNRLNPALGTPKEFDRFCKQLQKFGMKQILDVVPNHMGIKGGENAWWQDVLEKGPESRYAKFFDINWRPEKMELGGRVLMPILGTSYSEALEKQQIELHYLGEETFQLQYADFPLPLSEKSYPIIWELVRNRKDEKQIKAAIAKINRDPNLMDALLEAQFYRLSYWKLASHEINYRRFFNIHELVALRIEDLDVLEAHHRWLFELIQEGRVQGLRIDHPDGLYDPSAYFKQLRERCHVLTLVEKILDRKESLPESWDVEGTVGYEYLNLLGGLFVQQSHEKAFDEIYEEFAGKPPPFEEIVYQSKKRFALHEMVSEVRALGIKLDRLSEKSRDYRDFSRHELTQALGEVIACFPVYRTYVSPQGKVSRRDSRIIKIAIEKAKSHSPHLDPSLFEFIEKLLLLKLKNGAHFREFVLQFQQLTAPIMAKGLEDTAFYRYNRFLPLNEVGGDPPCFGRSVAEFHRFNQQKLQKWPYGLLASSTHDTKRSEDVRMRLSVLSEIPMKWHLEVKKWSRLSQKYKGESVSTNTEYMIYQTLLGGWPGKSVAKGDYPALRERFWVVILKSIREAKEETSWMFPNVGYEMEVQSYLYSLLTPTKRNHFLEHFLSFQKEIDRYGQLNSISATALKLGSCGIVDIYEGNETFHYRLVDPDNRAPLDFEAIKKQPITPKLQLYKTLLPFRCEHRELFLKGDYIPLTVRGKLKDHVVAFLRRHEEEQLVVLAARFFTSLPQRWGDTRVLLPKGCQTAAWTDLFTEKQIRVKTQKNMVYFELDSLMKHFGTAYLYAEN